MNQFLKIFAWVFLAISVVIGGIWGVATLSEMYPVVISIAIGFAFIAGVSAYIALMIWISIQEGD